jgi:hypothetical protein
MTEINSRAKLFQKIASVMGKVERVPKNGYNNFHKYQYVTESDLIESVRVFMSEEGLIVFNNVKSYEINGEVATVTIEFTLACTETGETITSVMVGQGQDKGDKAFYKAYAGATKYFLMKTFLIPTGDDPEADHSTDERNASKGNTPKEQTPNQNKVKLASEKQMNLINKLLSDVAVSTGITKEDAAKTLQKHMRKDLEWYTPADASKAIEILNNALKQGA